MVRRGLRIYLGFFFLTIFLVSVVHAATFLQAEKFWVSIYQKSPSTLQVDYRLLAPASGARISAFLNSKMLPRLGGGSYPHENEIVSILFLVDTSNPRRQKVIDQNIRDILAILSKAKPHHRYGLATFDTELKFLAPIGTGTERIRETVKKMRAMGLTTELYLNVRKALEKMVMFPARRRMVFLLSDGKAEDTAYKNEDVVRFAKKHGIIIYGIGYAENIGDSVKLQTLKRLSEETGGEYIAAAVSTLVLPRNFLNAPFAGLENGGWADFDLTPGFESSLAEKMTVRIRLSAFGSETEILAAVVSPPLSPRRFFGVARFWATRPSVLMGTGGAVFLLLILVRIRRRGRQVSTIKPFAILEFLDGDATKHPITSHAVRIGRGPGNDIYLSNTSISEHHAEIHKKRDQKFVITDLNSLNGVYVNKERKNVAELENNDIVELGEVRFRFVIPPAD